jgi:hypothetical protein
MKFVPSIFHFLFTFFPIGLCALLSHFARGLGQTVPTSGGHRHQRRAESDLITYSDLVWQPTLEPSPVFDPRQLRSILIGH